MSDSHYGQELSDEGKGNRSACKYADVSTVDPVKESTSVSSKAAVGCLA